MDTVYVLFIDDAEWEDVVIFLSEEEAIKKSKKCPTARVELFTKSPKGGYYPSYKYYLNGEYIEK